MTTHPIPTPAIAQDIPCITCGYNLRGLAPTSLCPECGTPIQRSVDARMKLIISSPRIWARMVLAGLVVWLMLTPYFIIATAATWRSVLWDSPLFPWLNYPGPRVWAFHLLGSFYDLPRMIVALGLALALYLITWPRHPGAGIEPPLDLRSVTRWSCVVLISALAVFGMNTETNRGISPVLGTLVLLTTELPCTLLTYFYVSDLARRLDLSTESRWLRRCGWIAALAMLASVVMITVKIPPRSAHQPMHQVGLWAGGAIVGTAAVVATGSLIRVALALWPIAMSKSASSIR